MLDRIDWQKAVKNAEHYKALDIKRIYLFDECDKPWKFVTSCEPGGSHRLEISTDIRFVAKHPCGLQFDWCFDIEPRSADGKSGYYIDVEGIQRVMELIPLAARASLSEYLKECADKVEAKADDYQEEAKRQYGAAAALRKSAQIELLPA